MANAKDMHKASVATVLSPDRVKQLLGEVEERRNPILKIVQQVCKGLKPAAFFFGPGGHGKTYNILGQMDLMADRGWVHHTGGLTPRGLFDSFLEKPDAIHVIEDVEDVGKSQDFADLLRPACDDGSDRSRAVRHKTARHDLKVDFGGGVIIISNSDISKTSGPMAAVASRFKPVKWSLSVNELLAVMWSMAGRGYSKRGNIISPKDCHEVVDWISERATSGEAIAGLDLRFLTQHAYPAYIQAKQDGKGESWKDVCMSMLRGETVIADARVDRNEQLEKIALQISLMPLKTQERWAKWAEMTGRTKSRYIHHLRNARLGQEGKAKKISD